MPTQLETLASFLPTVGIVHANSGLHAEPHARPTPCGLLLADIAGFTPLAERLAARGPEGAEALTHCLNQVFGRLTELVRTHGGDTLKFAGDALLAIWPEPLAMGTLRAASCALAIPGTLEDVHLPEGMQLAFKLAVGAGTVRVAPLGGLFDRFELFVAGDPLAQVARASERAAPGSVVLSQEAYAGLGLVESARGRGYGRGSRAGAAQRPPRGNRRPRGARRAVPRGRARGGGAGRSRRARGPADRMPATRSERAAPDARRGPRGARRGESPLRGGARLGAARLGCAGRRRRHVQAAPDHGPARRRPAANAAGRADPAHRPARRQRAARAQGRERGGGRVLDRAPARDLSDRGRHAGPRGALRGARGPRSDRAHRRGRRDRSGRIPLSQPGRPGGDLPAHAVRAAPRAPSPAGRVVRVMRPRGDPFDRARAALARGGRGLLRPGSRAGSQGAAASPGRRGPGRLQLREPRRDPPPPRGPRAARLAPRYTGAPRAGAGAAAGARRAPGQRHELGRGRGAEELRTRARARPRAGVRRAAIPGAARSLAVPRRPGPVRGGRAPGPAHAGGRRANRRQEARARDAPDAGQHRVLAGGSEEGARAARGRHRAGRARARGSVALRTGPRGGEPGHPGVDAVPARRARGRARAGRPRRGARADPGAPLHAGLRLWRDHVGSRLPGPRRAGGRLGGADARADAPAGEEFAYLETASRVVAGWSRALLDDPDGTHAVSRAIGAWRDTGASIGMPVFLATLADAYLATGRVDEAQQALDDPLLVGRGASEGWLEPFVRYLRARILEAQGSADAQPALRDAERFAKSRGARLIERRIRELRTAR